MFVSWQLSEIQILNLNIVNKQYNNHAITPEPGRRDAGGHIGLVLDPHEPRKENTNQLLCFIF